MMKESIIICIIIVLVIIGSTFSEKYLEKTSNGITEELAMLNKRIDNVQNVDELSKDVEKIDQKWEKTKEVWATFVDHQEIDQIELALTEAKSYINENNKTDSKVQIEKAQFLLEHIPERQKLKLKNIL